MQSVIAKNRPVNCPKTIRKTKVFTSQWKVQRRAKDFGKRILAPLIPSLKVSDCLNKYLHFEQKTDHSLRLSTAF